MKTNTKKIYEKYYGAVAGRFYARNEKRSLLGLFCREEGIAEDSAEFAVILRTVGEVETEDIVTVADCQTYLLLASEIPSRSERCKAVKALKTILEKNAKKSTPEYFDAIDWRISVFKEKNRDISARLEAAYIEYASGKKEKAIEDFAAVAERCAHLPSVYHLAEIYREAGEKRKSLGQLLIIKEILSGVLGIECEEYIENSIGRIREHLGEEEYGKILKEAKEYARANFGYGAVSKNTIGFNVKH